MWAWAGAGEWTVIQQRDAGPELVSEAEDQWCGCHWLVLSSHAAEWNKEPFQVALSGLSGLRL